MLQEIQVRGGVKKRPHPSGGCGFFLEEPIGIENVTVTRFTDMVWRTTIPKNNISLVPKNNYTSQNQQSKAAPIWLKYNDLFLLWTRIGIRGKEIWGKGHSCQ